jgi:hypothetical protein
MIGMEIGEEHCSSSLSKRERTGVVGMKAVVRMPVRLLM